MRLFEICFGISVKFCFIGRVKTYKSLIYKASEELTNRILKQAINMQKALQGKQKQAHRITRQAHSMQLHYTASGKLANSFIRQAYCMQNALRGKQKQAK